MALGRYGWYIRFEGVFMPAGYERMKEKFKRGGMSDKAAKEKAARIWNSKHKKDSVTRRGHG